LRVRHGSLNAYDRTWRSDADSRGQAPGLSRQEFGHRIKSGWCDEAGALPEICPYPRSVRRDARPQMIFLW